MDISIVMLAYNHERFIEQAIQSVLMQKTDYQYELIIGEDCSPDKTREIIRKYEQQYPDKLRPLYREKNMGMARNMLDCLKHCTGKYIAFLEGDDYWTSPDKLQIQTDFLESHPDYAAVYHNWEIVNISGQWQKDGHQTSEAYDFTKEQLENFELPGQTGTILMRNLIKEMTKKEMRIAVQYAWLPGDRLVLPLLLSRGKIRVLPEKYSAYRFYQEQDGTNWSSINEKPQNHLFFFAMKLGMERLMKRCGMQVDFYQAREVEFFKNRDAMEWSKQRSALQRATFLMLLLEPHRIKLFREWLRYHRERKKQ